MSNAPESLLTDEEHAHLSAIVARLGETQTAERLGICRTSVLRLLCRRPARPGTVALARISMAKSAP